MGIPKHAKTKMKQFTQRMQHIIGARIVKADAVYVDDEVWPFLEVDQNGQKLLVQPTRDGAANRPGDLQVKEP